MPQGKKPLVQPPQPAGPEQLALKIREVLGPRDREPDFSQIKIDPNVDDNVAHLFTLMGDRYPNAIKRIGRVSKIDPEQQYTGALSLLLGPTERYALEVQDAMRLRDSRGRPAKEPLERGEMAVRGTIGHELAHAREAELFPQTHGSRGFNNRPDDPTMTRAPEIGQLIRQLFYDTAGRDINLPRVKK